MYNINRTNIFKNWYTDLYIATKSGMVEDDYLNETPTYNVPVHYKRWNIQYVTKESELIEFGQNVTGMRVAVIPNNEQYRNAFSEFDLAYLDGANPEGEIVNGQNANYAIYSVRPQNTIIKVYLKKIVK